MGQASCSKKTVLRRQINERRVRGHQLLVVGDGKVEIGLGRQVGAVTLGTAANEINRRTLMRSSANV